MWPNASTRQTAVDKRHVQTGGWNEEKIMSYFEDELSHYEMLKSELAALKARRACLGNEVSGLEKRLADQLANPDAPEKWLVAAKKAIGDKIGEGSRLDNEIRSYELAIKTARLQAKTAVDEKACNLVDGYIAELQGIGWGQVDEAIGRLGELSDRLLAKLDEIRAVRSAYLKVFRDFRFPGNIKPMGEVDTRAAYLARAVEQLRAAQTSHIPRPAPRILPRDGKLKVV
jgi:hypothetical protein